MMKSIDADIQAINRGIDRIFREYGGESAVYKDITKFLRGSDAPQTYQSKSGALHISRGTKANRSGSFGRQVQKIRESIPSAKELKSYGSVKDQEDFFQKYINARDEIGSKLGEWYYRKDRGLLSDREEKIFDRASDILGASYNTKQELVAVFEILDEPFDD